MTNDPKTPHAWRRFILPLAAAMVPAGIGLTCLLTTQLRSYSEFKVEFLNNNRVNIQVAVQVAAAVLGGLQFYAVSSVLRFRTNARAFASDEGLAQGRRSGMTLDALKIRSAVVRGVMDFDLRWPVVLQILVWWLFLKSIAPMWAGTITPKLGQAQIPGVVNISNYDEASRSGWGTRAGALQNVIATASTKTADDQTSRYPRLDNTGYWYSTRSYGVGMSAGLNQTRWTGRSGVIQSYGYQESGYWTNVECKRNVTKPEWWHIANFEDGSFTFTNSRAQMHLGWAWADLPNGNWSGSQVWSENESLNTTVVIANSNQRGRYMYGFVAGDAYPSLQGVQCSVIFKPTKFDILVNDTDKSIQVKPITGSNDDIDPSRDLVNNAFRSVSYLSQTMTTLYTSVLGDAFLDNIDMFFYQHENERLAETNGKIDATEMHVMRGIQDGLEVLLDQIFGILANGHRAAWWTHYGEVGYIYTSAAFSLLVLLAVVGEMARIAYGVWKNRVPRAGPSLDILDIKSAILGTARGVGGATLSAVQGWSGRADDSDAGALMVTMEAEAGVLKLTDRSAHKERKRMSQYSQLGRFSSGMVYQSPVENRSGTPDFGYQSPADNQTEKTPFTKTEAV
ncbi:hypothetical protein GGTG_05093 [Gaeumannomyces tritici R3-111a-1]|uniref:Uncharacterized protein n=1 Tax=Gaeumannomyces tritici (strain R3-111a-1) TaxID=644352 RepID=J3NUY4_GAET3|nr:hypothetical protein GGTG_05093 [Gaeumannomyces tritici R3-111a-1]EJT75156.1 hypothetical protein GGTG_05093 [Gaeumannomyces tritici R3-111a-1]